MDNSKSPLPTRMCTKDVSLENPLQRDIILQWSFESNTRVT